MISKDLHLDGVPDADIQSNVSRMIAAVPGDAVFRIRVHGQPSERARSVLSAARLRQLTPPTMNVDVRFADAPGGRPR